VSAGARIAARYRGTASDRLRATRPLIRNPRCQAAIDIVLTERAEAHQRGYDAGQTLLDVLGGVGVQEMHARATDAAMREFEGKRFLEADQAMGMADALWEWIQDRSDT
jgi:hypothetical protein